MKFKYKRDKSKFNKPPDWVDIAAFMVLKMVVQIIDMMSLLLGCGEIWITCYIAGRAYKSQHPKGLAVDIRCCPKGAGKKPRKWFWMMKLLGKTLHAFNPDIRFVMHEKLLGTPDQHVHVEVREGAKL